MKKISIDPGNIDYKLVKIAADAIVNNGVVALPTETVYGLAVRADKTALIDKLYEIKKRPKNKLLSLAIADPLLAINQYFSPMPPFGYRLIDRFWPGPLTIIFYSVKNEKIGLRVPANTVTRAILKEAAMAVCLPSANVSGEKESISANQVEAAFPNLLDVIVDGGDSLHHQASTVLDLTFHPFKILRKGVILEEDIVDVFIRKRILFVCTGNTCRSPMAELLLKKILMEEGVYFIDRYEIFSRGVAASSGSGVSRSVDKLLSEEELIDTSQFYSNKLDRNDILSSDIIITMEKAHKDYILNLEPTAEGRVFNLTQFLSYENLEDVPDPIGKDHETYRNAYDLIKRGLLEFKNWL